MSDVVLIHSPLILYKDIEDRKGFLQHGGDEKSLYPLGILYLTSYLEKSGYSAKIIDVAAEDKTLVDIMQVIEQEKPRIVGISSMTTSIASSVSLAQEIKKKYADDILVGLGGVHLCCDHTFLERFPVFDFGVVGEAEKTFAEIVKKVKQGEKIEGTVNGELTEDLDTLPFPARAHIRPNTYLRKEQLSFEIPSAPILASRGCPFSCIFCAIPVIGQKVRMRSPENIVDEMEEVYEQNRGNYHFIDDCFTLDRNRILTFCQEIIDRKMKVRFIASTRPNALDEDVVKALSRVGCTDLFLGVESGNQRIRNKVIKKRITDKEILKAIRLCRKYRILSNLFLMVGFPGETKKEMMDTVRIGNKVKADMIGIHITGILPGTEIFNHALKNKLIPEDIIDRYASGQMGRGFRDVWPLFVPQGFSLKDLTDIKKLTYRRFYLNPIWWLRRLRVWFLMPAKFKEDLKLFRIAFHVFRTGGTQGQLS